jgi:hypothetical protein
MTKIDITKKYQTKGKEKAVLCLSKDGIIYGYRITSQGEVIPQDWDEETGKVFLYGRENHCDLVEVKEKKFIRGCFNIYADGTIVFHASREIADYRSICSNDRLACKEFEIEYEEGEGL